MPRKMLRLLRRVLVLLLVVAGTLLVARAWDSQRGPPLDPWHTHVPHDWHADEIDKADWAAYLKAEEAAFRRGARPRSSTSSTRRARDAGQPLLRRQPDLSRQLRQDWNRSYILEPDGHPGRRRRPAARTDRFAVQPAPHRAPLSRRGFVAVAIRMPGHGTVPAALTDVEWEDWDAATRLAVREARRRAGPVAPLHIVGFSNGGALAMKYALDAIDDQRLARPDRLVLISPMIGITSLRALCRVSRLGRRCSPPSPRRRGSASCRSSTPSSTTRSRSTARASRTG